MGEFIRDRLPDPIQYFADEGVPLKGPGVWKTGPCDFHRGSDSLRVNSQTGGWVCMSCGIKGGDVLAHFMARHGLEFVEAARLLGAYIEDGRPHRGISKPTTLPARAALELLSNEAMLVAVAAGNIAEGVALTVEDRARLVQAAGRIGLVAEEFRA